MKELNKYDKIIREKFHCFSDEEWDSIKTQFPFSEIPFILERFDNQTEKVEKLSYNINRIKDDNQIYTFTPRYKYNYKFDFNQLLEDLDDMSSWTSFSYNDYKQKVIDALVSEFRISLNDVVFGDPAGKEYVEYMKTQSLNIGDKIIVHCSLHTILDDIEDDKYYFKDEEGITWHCSLDELEKDNS